MNARRLPERNSRPTGIRRKPQPPAGEIPTAEQLIANLPARIRNHAGFNQTALEKTADRVVDRLCSCSSPEHGQGDIAAQIAAQVEQDLQPGCVQSSVGHAPGSGEAVGFVFEGIALYLIRIFAELAARQMLKWAWGWINRRMANG